MRVLMDKEFAQAVIAESQGATPRTRKAFLDTELKLALELQEWLMSIRSSTRI